MEIGIGDQPIALKQEGQCSIFVDVLKDVILKMNCDRDLEITKIEARLREIEERNLRLIAESEELRSTLNQDSLPKPTQIYADPENLNRSNR